MQHITPQRKIEAQQVEDLKEFCQRIHGDMEIVLEIKA